LSARVRLVEIRSIVDPVGSVRWLGPRLSLRMTLVGKMSIGELTLWAVDKRDADDGVGFWDS
jgi:hypothetical protein